ncbi:MAG: metallophosphoesterase [Chitinophagales bacterium]
MLQRLFALTIPIVLLLLIDSYTFQAFKTATHQVWVHYAYWVITMFAYLVLAVGIVTGFRTWNKKVRSYIGGFFMSIYLAKFVIIGFLMIDDVVRLGRWFWMVFLGEGSTPIERIKIISQIGLFAASIPFVAMLKGMIHNAHNYLTRKHTLQIDHLPSVFEGFKIIQISDIHTGSLVNKTAVEGAIETINALEADIVFFTGDLVNNFAAEAQPFVDIFKKIKAKYGVYSITGNHDYGDYSRWESEEAKRQNFELLIDTHKRMGWKLLLNEHAIIEVGGKQLVIIGVENWSANKRFRNYGDLAKAYKGAENADLQLLLSHDPSHWRAEVLQLYPKIAATFSGHTHGFQFGINTRFYKWSPVKYAYKEWMGLYQEGTQYLYVNPGFGYVGYPGRVGFLPEITVVELTSKT